MNPELQIKAIAELDGKEYHKPTEAEIKLGSYYQFEPNYLQSRDAIVPIREKLVNTQALKDEWMELAVMVILESQKEVDEYALTHLTAAQECQTLLLLFKKLN